MEGFLFSTILEWVKADIGKATDANEFIYLTQRVYKLLFWVYCCVCKDLLYKA